MSTKLDPTEDTQYIVGRPFQTSEGWAWPGEPAPEEAVISPNLYALLSAGFLYAYVPDANYAYLPPHVFSAVKTYQEVNDIIARGEAPIEMEWTPPKKLQTAIDNVDAEELSKLAAKTSSPATAEDWTHKLEVNQISPRPVELPAEKLFTDSKKGEAEEVADDSEDDGEDRLDVRAKAAEEAFKDLVETPQYHASEDNPLRPEFDDGDLQDTFEEVQAVTDSKKQIEVVEGEPAILDRMDPFNNQVFSSPQLEPDEREEYAEELKEEWAKEKEAQAEDTEPVQDPDIEQQPEELDDPVPAEPTEVDTGEPTEENTAPDAPASKSRGKAKGKDKASKDWEGDHDQGKGNDPKPNNDLPGDQPTAGQLPA